MDLSARKRFLREEFRNALLELAPADGDFSVAENVRVFRRSAPSDMFHGESSVSYCGIAQGAKHI